MICGKATGMVTNCMDLKPESSSENDHLSEIVDENQSKPAGLAR